MLSKLSPQLLKSVFLPGAKWQVIFSGGLYYILRPQYDTSLWMFEDDNICLDFSELSQEDKKILFDFFEKKINEPPYLTRRKYLDLSGCRFGDSSSIFEIEPYFKNIKGKCKFYLLPGITDFDQLTITQKEILLLEDRLNGESREVYGEDLMNNTLGLVLLGQILVSKIDTFVSQVEVLQEFHPNVLGIQFLESFQQLSAHSFNPSADQLLKCSQQLLDKIKQNFKKERDIFSGDFFELFEKRMRTPKYNNITQNYQPLLWLAWFSAIFLRSLYIPKSETEKEKCRNLLCELFSLSNYEERVSCSQLFFDMLKNHPKELFLFLEETNHRRRYIISVLLSIIYKENLDKNVLEFFNNQLYDEGVYNRVAAKALRMLATDEEISSENKRFLVCYCCDLLEANKENTKHYGIWSLMVTLLNEGSEKIEIYLNYHKNCSSEITLEKIYWKIFTDTLKLKKIDYSEYITHFDPEHNLRHHLLFGFRQVVSVMDRGKINNLIKTFLFDGNLGYRRLRYESTNPHLDAVFSRPGGVFLKTFWKNCDYSGLIQSNSLKGCRVYITDGLWDLLTWGEGINCLEPLAGGEQSISHLLNGQHQLVLIRDQKNKVLAGYLVHLLLFDSENPTPVLAVGKTYIRGDIVEPKAKHEIQSILDNMLVTKARDMGLPFIALILKDDAASNIPRDLSQVENGPSVLIKRGYYHLCDGMDDHVLGEKEGSNQNDRKIYHYQVIYSPARPELLAMTDAKASDATLLSDWEKWKKEYNFKNPMAEENGYGPGALLVLGKNKSSLS